MISNKIALLFLILHAGYTVVINGPVFDPPPPDEAARMARYIMANSEWISIATISTMKNIKGYPFNAVQSVSDGTPSNSTGVPYLYLTDLDATSQDLAKDNRCTITASLAATDYCDRKKFDPEDPRCARLMITGRMLKLDKKSPEYQFGENALFSKHPVMKSWPKDHNFYVTKLDIEQLALFDFFGGMKYISNEDYFNVSTHVFEDIIFERVEFIEITA